MSTELASITEVLPATALEAMTKAEVDIQVATAHRFPRVPSKAIQEATVLACTTPEIAESMAYALPRDGKTIDGPSVRFAEIVAYSWGNIRAAARIIEVTATEVVAQGVCHDLEKNVATSTEVRRRITNKYGKRFSDDMIIVTGNAAASIAFRNAVFKVIPPSLFNGVLEAAKEKSKDVPLAKRVTKVREWLKYIKVEEERALGLVGKTSWALVTVEDMELFQGLRVAINEGSTTLEEAFPAPEKKRSAPTADEGSKDSLPLRKEQPAPTMESEDPGPEEPLQFDDETGEVTDPETPDSPTPPPAPELPKFATCPDGGPKAGKSVVTAWCVKYCGQRNGCPGLVA